LVILNKFSAPQAPDASCVGTRRNRPSFISEQSVIRGIPCVLAPSARDRLRESLRFRLIVRVVGFAQLAGQPGIQFGA
jgi:hypothetical protein